MLYEFSVRNYGPFREKATLNLQCTKNGEHPDNVIRNRKHGDILSSGLIFGPNASGKSYLLEGIGALQRILGSVNANRDSLRWYEPFRLSEETLSQPTEFSICLTAGEELYRYTVAFTSSSIVAESLQRIGRHDIDIFGREDGTFFLSECKDVTGFTSPTSAYLKVAASYNDEVCNRVLDAILNIRFVRGDSLGDSVYESYEYLKNHPSAMEVAMDALNTADFHISAMRGVKHEVPMKWPYEDRSGSGHPMEYMFTRIGTELFLTHDYRSTPEQLREFPLSIESNGTRNMLGIIGPVAEALTEGGVLVIDEFGSCLHPMLTRWIIKLFAADYNVKGAQLIVNTHDLGLMDIQTLVRRDQIYFVNKDWETGASELYSLSDFNGVRKDTRVLDAYLLGRFDAVPNMISPRGRIS